MGWMDGMVIMIIGLLRAPSALIIITDYASKNQVSSCSNFYFVMAVVFVATPVNIWHRRFSASKVRQFRNDGSLQLIDGPANKSSLCSGHVTDPTNQSARIAAIASPASF